MAKKKSTKSTKKVVKKSNAEKNTTAFNYILMGAGIILLIIATILIINKFNKSDTFNMLVQNRSATFDKYIGKWYQDNDLVDYINIKETENNRIKFDLNAHIVLKNLETILVDNESTMKISNEFGDFKLDIKLENKEITVRIHDSNNEYLKENEIFNFKIK